MILAGPQWTDIIRLDTSGFKNFSVAVECKYSSIATLVAVARYRIWGYVLGTQRIMFGGYLSPLIDRQMHDFTSHISDIRVQAALIDPNIASDSLAVTDFGFVPASTSRKVIFVTKVLGLV